MAKSLYICYFGLREPLVQTQVLPYLRELLKDGHAIHLLTFEPDESIKKGGFEEIQRRLAEQGIEWSWLKYHKRPSLPATLFDIFWGSVYVHRFISRHRPDILHGRVHLPTLIGAIARKFSSHKPKLIFDIRGFFPEEYTDAGLWPANGWLYRQAKRVERWLVRESDGFVILTESAREILFPESRDSGLDRCGRPVRVIPCCVDLSKFPTLRSTDRNGMRSELAVGDRVVLTYVGSFGGWYLSDEMIEFFTILRNERGNVFFLILTQRDRDLVYQKFVDNGFIEQEFFVGSVEPKDIPRYLSAADIAVSFIKACFSKKSSSPTKIAEYLACGLPIVSNSGIGDLDKLIKENDVGVILRDLNSEEYLIAFDSLNAGDDIRQRCRKVAEETFDLVEVGGLSYRRLYREMDTL